MTVSVCTLVADRDEHLRNVVAGLTRSSSPPDEVVVAWMSGPDPRAAMRPLDCPTVVVDVPRPDAGLPLARARNAAAAAASGDRLVFLDVDCIPGEGLVEAYAQALAEHDGIAMGTVRYLPAGAADGDWDETALVARSVEHPDRPAPAAPGWTPTGRYELFWSLSFAVRAGTFSDRLGGFDEAFTGYGGEDTDLAWTARERGVPLGWTSGAVAYHQDHLTHTPPLGHLEAIARNAQAFHAKWGEWPMGGWLADFQRLGLVRWTEDELEVLRSPTDEELARTAGRAFPGQAARPA